MTNPLAEACCLPFSNGTERRAWEGVWCDFCVHDHGISHSGDGDPDSDGMGCSILLEYDAYCGTAEWRWPEAWLPEPDDGRFFLPSRMICGQFTPCHQGTCVGDPGAEERAERVVEVSAYWSDRK